MKEREKRRQTANHPPNPPSKANEKEERKEKRRRQEGREGGREGGRSAPKKKARRKMETKIYRKKNFRAAAAKATTTTVARRRKKGPKKKKIEITTSSQPSTKRACVCDAFCRGPSCTLIIFLLIFTRRLSSILTHPSPSLPPKNKSYESRPLTLLTSFSISPTSCLNPFIFSSSTDTNLE